MNTSALFKAALKKGYPSITDEQSNRAWNTLAAQTDVSKVDPKELSQLAYKISKAMSSRVKPGFQSGGLVDEENLPPALDQVNVTGRAIRSSAPDINVPNSYLTPEQSSAQSQMLSQNQAALLKGNMNDPDMLKQAYADYKKYLEGNQTGRAISGYMAGSVAGSSGGQSVTSNAAAWEAADKKAADMTIGLQKALMEQYKQGMDTNKQLLSDLKESGKFTMDASKERLAQTKTQAELIPILQDMDNRKTWSNPDSAQSKAIQDSAAIALNKLGYSFDFINSHIAGRSGVQIASIMSGIIPNTVDTLKKAADTAAVQTGAAKTGAEISGVAATSAITSAAAKTQINPDGTLTTQPGQVTAISAGPMSITNPGADEESQAAAKSRTDAAQQFKIYDTVTKPAIDDALKLIKNSYSGKGAKAMASLIPGNDQAMIANALMQVYHSYPEAIDPAIGNNIKSQMNKPGWTGTPTLAITGTQAANMLMQAKANIERMKQYRTKQTEFEQKGGKSTDFYKTQGSIRYSKGGTVVEVPVDDKQAIKDLEADGFKKE